LFESVAVMAKLKVPDCEEVPEISPVAEFSVKSSGSAPPVTVKV
jgi:hypothetical protein